MTVPFTFRFQSFLPLGIALGSGLIMSLAIAPLNLWFLAWIALAPLWVIVVDAEKILPSSKFPSVGTLGVENKTQNYVSPLLCAFAWSLGYYGRSLSWILGLHPLTWLGVPWLASVAIALCCWIFITLWGTACVVFWAWVMGQWGQSRGGANFGMSPVERGQGSRGARKIIHNSRFPAVRALRIETRIQDYSARLSSLLAPLSFLRPPFAFHRVLIGTALWCATEWLRNQTPLDWAALSLTQSPGNAVVLHLGQLSGSLMVTASLVAVNGLLAEAWIGVQRAGSRQQAAEKHPNVQQPTANNSQQSPLWAALVLFLMLHGVGFTLYSQPLQDSEAAALKVGIVQGNVPTRIKLFAEGLRRAEEGYTSGYELLATQRVQAVLTPEGALPYVWNQGQRAGDLFEQAVLEKGVVAWLGTFMAQGGNLARSLITLTKTGEVLSRYDKVKLVPLGEYVPFQEVLGTLIGKLTTVAENGLPGTLKQSMDTPFGRAIASICYDSAFPEVFRGQAARGGQFILTAANLDPYSEVLMAQHQAHDLMRAIETDRWAVRATNTGYSSVINPHGTILWRSSPHRYQTHAETIYRRQTQTMYVRWGDWLTPLLVGLATLSGLVQNRWDIR